MFERFSHEARLVVVSAQEHAREGAADSIRSEHLLAAIVSGALERTRAARGRAPRGHIPFDRGAKKVLELALREALRLKHNVIGAEHILLGMLHSETGVAQQILASHGVGLDATRVVVDELVRGRQAG